MAKKWRSQSRFGGMESLFGEIQSRFGEENGEVNTRFGEENGEEMAKKMAKKVTKYYGLNI